MGALPHEAVPVSKLEFGARLPVSGLTGTQRKPERRLAARSFPELVGNIRVNSEDVRFGSKADISACVRDVRFTPKSGHFQRRLRCPLSAKSGHWPTTRFRFSSRASGDTATASDRMPRSAIDHRRLKCSWQRLSPGRHVRRWPLSRRRLDTQRMLHLLGAQVCVEAGRNGADKGPAARRDTEAIAVALDEAVLVRVN